MHDRSLRQLNYPGTTESNVTENAYTNKTNVINPEFPHWKQNESIDVPEETQYVYEAKEYSRSITPPKINVKKGYKAIVKITQEPLNTNVESADFVENQSFDKYLVNRIMELEERLNTLQQENEVLTNQLFTYQNKVKEIEEMTKVESINLSVRGGIFKLNSSLINKIGSVLLLLISVFVFYGLFTNSMFSPVGGFLILIICLFFSVLFWIYSIKTKESRC